MTRTTTAREFRLLIANNRRGAAQLNSRLAVSTRQTVNYWRSSAATSRPVFIAALSDGYAA